MRGTSDALWDMRSNMNGAQSTHIRPVAHANRWDLETFDGMSVPPIGCTEQPNFLVCGQFADQVGNGRVQERAVHRRHGTEGSGRRAGRMEREWAWWWNI